MSTKRRTPGIYASPAPKGPNGERLCRNCRTPLAKGQRHNCSPKCSDEWMCKTSPSHLRYKLRQRDKGVCAICGVDTIALKRQYDEYCGLIKQGLRVGWDYATSSRQWAERTGWLKDKSIPLGRECSDWWDADHIIPVVEGGGECGLDNYRTLCIPCHKKETAGLRARLAARKRADKPQIQLALVMEA